MDNLGHEEGAIGIVYACRFAGRRKGIFFSRKHVHIRSYWGFRKRSERGCANMRRCEKTKRRKSAKGNRGEGYHEKLWRKRNPTIWKREDVKGRGKTSGQ